MFKPLRRLISLCVLVVFAGNALGQANEPTLAPELDAPPLFVPEGEAAPEAEPEGAQVPTLAPEIDAEEVLPAPATRSAPAAAPPPKPAPKPAVVLSPGPMTREQHPWARHEPGSWRRLRIVSESFDQRGLLVGRSETFRRETLVEGSEAGYTLRVETTVDAGGRRIPGPTQQLAFGLTAQSPEAEPTLVDDAPSAISLGGRAIPCETWVWSAETDRGESQHTLQYSAEVAPFLLHHERADLVDGRAVREDVFRVVRLSIPVEYGGAIVDTYHSVRESSSSDGDATSEFTVHADSVPGGLLSRGATETDAAGRRVRWTVTQLVEYGARGGPTRRASAVAAAPVEIVPEDFRPRRWMRLLRRGGIHLSEDDLDDLEDDLEDLQDELEDLYDD